MAKPTVEDFSYFEKRTGISVGDSVKIALEEEYYDEELDERVTVKCLKLAKVECITERGDYHFKVLFIGAPKADLLELDLNLVETMVKEGQLVKI